MAKVHLSRGEPAIGHHYRREGARIYCFPSKSCSPDCRRATRSFNNWVGVSFSWTSASPTMISAASMPSLLSSALTSVRLCGLTILLMNSFMLPSSYNQVNHDNQDDSSKAYIHFWGFITISTINPMPAFLSKPIRNPPGHEIRPSHFRRW
jgi:hypothetical protein